MQSSCRKLCNGCIHPSLNANDPGGIHHGHWVSIIPPRVLAVSRVGNAVIRKGDVAHIRQEDEAVWSGPGQVPRATPVVATQNVDKGRVVYLDLG